MKKVFLLLMLLIPVTGVAQTAAFNGYSYQGAVSAQTSGLPSSNKLLGVIPQCNVEVFLTGTVTKATIYSDASSTPLTNPFTADQKAKWLFFAAENQGYDVVMSGGIPPLTYPSPVTLTDLIVGGSGGGAFSAFVNGVAVTTPGSVNFINSSSVTVTNPSTNQIQFTAVNTGANPCAPAFSVQAANSGVTGFTCDSNITIDTTNHALDVGGTITGNAFSLTNLSTIPADWTEDVTEPQTALSSIAGNPAAGTYSILCADATHCATTPAGSGTITNFEHNDTLLTGQFAPIAGVQIFDLNDTTPAAPSGNQNVTFQTDTATGRVSAYVGVTAVGFAPVTQPPISGQNIEVYPDSCSPGFAQDAAGVTACSTSNGGPAVSGLITCTSGGLVLCNHNLQYNFSLPTGLTQPQITHVFAVVTNAFGGISTYATGGCDGVDLRAANGAGMQSVTSADLGTPTINTLTCVFNLQSSGLNVIGGRVQIGGIVLYVYYTGTPISSPVSTPIYSPLITQNGGIALSLPYNFGVDTVNTDNYAVTLPAYSLPPNGLQSGQDFWISIAHANTSTTPTMTFNGIGPWGILKGNNTALAAGDMVASSPANTGAIGPYAHFVFENNSGGGGFFELLNPVNGSGGSTTNALTAAASGGASPGSTFNGSAAVTFDYHSFGAAGLAAANTFTGSLDDFSAVTQIKIPVAAGYTAAANGEIGYDSTNSNLHMYNGADAILAPLAAGFVSGHCGQPTLSGGKWSVVDTGAACGLAGGTAFSSITGATNTTAAMVVGSGASLDFTGTGTIDANKINGSAVPTSSTCLSSTSGGVLQSGGCAAQVSASFIGTPGNGQIIILLPLTTAFTVPTGCTNSHLDGLAAATGSTTFTLYYRAGGITGTKTSFGTAVVSASGQSAAFTCASGHSFSAGDYVEVDGPATADATFANIGFGLYGTK